MAMQNAVLCSRRERQCRARHSRTYRLRCEIRKYIEKVEQGLVIVQAGGGIGVCSVLGRVCRPRKPNACWGLDVEHGGKTVPGVLVELNHGAVFSQPERACVRMGVQHGSKCKVRLSARCVAALHRDSSLAQHKVSATTTTLPVSVTSPIHFVSG